MQLIYFVLKIIMLIYTSPFHWSITFQSVNSIFHFTLTTMIYVHLYSHIQSFHPRTLSPPTVEHKSTFLTPIHKVVFNPSSWRKIQTKATLQNFLYSEKRKTSIGSIVITLKTTEFIILEVFLNVSNYSIKTSEP